MINNDYIDTFVHGFVVRQEMNDRLAEAEQRRLFKRYQAAHPETRYRFRLARLLRTAADRLAPEPQARPRLRVVNGHPAPTR